jgi:hypothetical protein
VKGDWGKEAPKAETLKARLDVSGQRSGDRKKTETRGRMFFVENSGL